MYWKVWMDIVCLWIWLIIIRIWTSVLLKMDIQCETNNFISQAACSVWAYLHRGWFGGVADGAHPSIFYRNRAPDFVWVPQAKWMHQIVPIDFENYIFFSASKGQIPLRHFVSTEVPHLVLNLGNPLFQKNPGSAPVHIHRLWLCAQADYKRNSLEPKLL